MVELAHAYLPIDRRAALLRGNEIPTDVWGTALEADLSGFTALTESLAAAMGEQHGAEELTRRLNRIYEGLVREVHRYGGTVLGFSGDALTCWLDGDDGRRAVACALDLQTWVEECARLAAQEGTAALRMKVALATGATHRYRVGDPEIQLLEGLAGTLMDELATIEHGAQPGEIVLAASTRSSLGNWVRTGERGVLEAVAGAADVQPWPALDEDPEDLPTVRPWILPAVYERLRAGQGQFVAELRPTTTLFLRFSGIDYDAGPGALATLDTFIQAVQHVLTDWGGTLLQLTIGDKGSYLYAAFGAPVAHEDDPVRALMAALRLQDLSAGAGPVEPVSIGVAGGQLRAGAYGGSQRRTYGVLGDAVNLAARLMQAAEPGETLATQTVSAAVGGVFRWDRARDLVVKGKQDPVPVARLVGVDTARAPAPPEPAVTYGREQERAVLARHLQAARAGHGTVVALSAEAGMGKTHLARVLAAEARAEGIAVHEAECPSFGTSAAYHPWRVVLPDLLGVDPARPRSDAVASALGSLGEGLAARAPLVGPALGFEAPATEATANLDARVRKSALEATIVEWLRAAVTEPTLLVFDDCQWIDPLSEDLLDAVGRAARTLPLLIVLTLRPRDVAEGGPLRAARLANYEEMLLGPLDPGGIAAIIRARLKGHDVAGNLAETLESLAVRAEGNPFYAGELVDHILDLAAARTAAPALEDLPSSLQRLVLARIDRLAEPPRATLKVASVVGRTFAVDLLPQAMPVLGSLDQVEASVATLEQGNFVVKADGGQDEFAHAITREVTYETIVGETRAALHGRIGRVLESQNGGAEADVDLLAYHFGRSDDRDRRCHWVLLAAAAARARYANDAAISHYRNVLPLLAGPERAGAQLELGRALALTGAWGDAEEVFARAREEAHSSGDRAGRGRATVEQGELRRKQGRYPEAQELFDAAALDLEASGDTLGLAEVRHLSGTLAAQQGDTATAGARYAGALELWQRADERRGMARSLNGLGIVAEYEGRTDDAAARYRDALELLTALGDTWGVAALTNNLGMISWLDGDASAAHPLFARAVALQREVGDPHMLANFLDNFGNAARDLGDLATAAACYEEAFTVATDLGERWLLAYLIEDVAIVSAAIGDPGAAVCLAAAAGALRAAINAPLPEANRARLDGVLAEVVAALGPDPADRAREEGAAMDDEAACARAAAVLAAVKENGYIV